MDINETVFTREDWINFFRMIDNPPPPTERMRKAAEVYREIKEGNLVC